MFVRYLGFCTNWNGNFGICTTFSNPLVMAAGVSKDVKTAEAESPMHRIGLRRLQKIVDEVTNEVFHAHYYSQFNQYRLPCGDVLARNHARRKYNFLCTRCLRSPRPICRADFQMSCPFPLLYAPSSWINCPIQ